VVNYFSAKIARPVNNGLHAKGETPFDTQREVRLLGHDTLRNNSAIVGPQLNPEGVK
jgi:hypothetical protein